MTDAPFAIGPYWACPYTKSKVWGKDPTGKHGDVMVADVRGWGYLTGQGHAALGLDNAEAIRLQHDMAQRIADGLNAAARPAPQPVGVKVKPLVWEKDGKTHSAKTPFGEYRVASIHGEWMWLLAWMPTSVEDRIDKGIPRGKNSAESAKAAAQADYERRILSALDPQPARTFTEDEALAMVAHAWREAEQIAAEYWCEMHQEGKRGPVAAEIRQRVPTDATAALARVTDAARREALEEAAKEADSLGSPGYDAAEAIRALIDKP